MIISRTIRHCSLFYKSRVVSLYRSVVCVCYFGFVMRRRRCHLPIAAISNTCDSFLTYIYIIFGFRNHRRHHRHPKLAKKIFSNRNHLFLPLFGFFLASGKRKSNLSTKWTNLIAEQDAIVAPSIHSYSLSATRVCQNQKKDKTSLQIILSLSFLLSFVFSVIAFAFGFDSVVLFQLFFLLVGCIGWQPTTMEEKKRETFEKIDAACASVSEKIIFVLSSFATLAVKRTVEQTRNKIADHSQEGEELASFPVILIFI